MMYGRLLENPSRWGSVRRTIGIYLALALTMGAVGSPGLLAIDYFVSTTGDNGNIGTTSGSAFRTITHALTAAGSGDTINVAAGTYDDGTETFPLELESGLVILGANRATTIVSAPGGEAVFFSDGSLSSSTRVSGLTITHDSNDPNNIGILFELDDVTQTPRIDDNIFLGRGFWPDPNDPNSPKSFAGDGIQIMLTDTNGSDEVFRGLIENNTFTGALQNAIHGNNGYYYGGPLAGGLVDVLSPTIANNSFLGIDDGVDFELYGESGDRIEGDISPVVHDNTFVNLDDDALEIDVGGYGPCCGGGPDVNETGGLTLSPVFRDNTITSIDGDVVEVDIDFLETDPNTVVTLNAVISGNVVTDHTSGDVFDVDISFLYADADDGATTVFSPLITNNTVMGFENEGVDIDADYLYIDGTFTFSPTITNNRFTDGNDDDGMEIELGVVSGVGDVSSTVTITGNRIMRVEDEGIEIDFQRIYLEIDSTLTIAGNEISDPEDAGIEIDVYQVETSFDEFDWSIDDNRIDEAGDPDESEEEGMAISFYIVDFLSSSAATLSISGNTITNSRGGSSAEGIHLYMGDIGFDDGNPGDMISIIGNEITGNVGEGIQIDVDQVTDLDPNTLTFEIRDNFLSANGEEGLDIDFDDVADQLFARAECNTITLSGNVGVLVGAADDEVFARVDFGGGGAGSLGNNSIFGNATDPNDPQYDFENEDPNTVWAESNWWGTADPNAVAGRIDGDVDFLPILSAAPASSATVLLDDLLVGNQIEYTGTVEASGACGCAGVFFDMPIPTGTRVVAGSVATTHGTIINPGDPNDPNENIQVQIGALASGQTATVTFTVDVDPGVRKVTAQAEVTKNGGLSLSDDPAVAGGGPTVTAIYQIPTLEWYAMLLLALTLATMGWFMMRRRRVGVILGLALFAMVAGFTAIDAEAAENAVEKERVRKAPTMEVATVRAEAVRGTDRVMLTTSEGTRVSVGISDVEIVDRRKADRSALKQRRDGKRERDDDDRELDARALLDGTIGEGQPMLVTVRYEEGSPDEVRIVLFSTWEEARVRLEKNRERSTRAKARE